MIPIAGQPVLTAAEMRAAEQRAVARGTSLAELMARAGAGVAEATRRLAAGAKVLVLCGPGNNGGDGWIAAATLAAWGHPVRIAALGEPTTKLACAARARWNGPVETLADAAPAPVVVDALFGTGLSRPSGTATATAVGNLQRSALLRIAVDLPSNVNADDGAATGEEHVQPAHVTLALGALKRGHLLEPGATYCGEIRLLDIGVAITERSVLVADRPEFLLPQTNDHKFSRGLAIVVAGAMPGAARLAAIAAARAGAGYVVLLGDTGMGLLPHAIVRRDWTTDALALLLAGKRNAVVIVGPGLGRDDEASARLAVAIACGERLIVDGDALHLLEEQAFATFRERREDEAAVTLTPHAGEFGALFGDLGGSKVDAAMEAAERSGATVVFKGPDTVIATRDGEVTMLRPGSHWLSTAGSGDVLTGAIAASILNIPIGNAAAGGVWMHGEAARRLGPAFIADDLARELTAVRASL